MFDVEGITLVAVTLGMLAFFTTRPYFIFGLSSFARQSSTYSAEFFKRHFWFWCLFFAIETKHAFAVVFEDEHIIVRIHG